MAETVDLESANSSAHREPFLRAPARFDILSRRVPALSAPDDTDEQQPIEEVTRLLGALNAHVGDFRAGLELLDHAEVSADFAHNWGPIACRDAGAALMDFRDALKAMHAALAPVSSLRGARRELRPLERRFAAHFPAERAKRNGKVQPNQTAPRPHDDMRDAAILADVTRKGRQVTHARGRQAICFELSQHSLWTLVTLRNEVFGVFEDASQGRTI